MIMFTKKVLIFEIDLHILATFYIGVRVQALVYVYEYVWKLCDKLNGIGMKGEFPFGSQWKIFTSDTLEIYHVLQQVARRLPQ